MLKQTNPVALSAAQLKQLNSTPVTLLAAGGVGTFNNPVGVWLRFTAGLESFSTTDVLKVYLGEVQLSVSIIGPGAGFEGTENFACYRAIELGPSDLEDVENQPVSIRCDVDWAPAFGDGTAVVVLFYVEPEA